MQRHLRDVPCGLYDLRIMRIYPGSAFYDEMVAGGSVTDRWWLEEESLPTNRFLPGHLQVHLRHSHFSPVELQYWTLKLTRELDGMNAGSVAHVLRVGRRGSATKFAAAILAARRRFVKQAQTLLERVEQAMAANAGKPSLG
jgi:hypothetical protein